jgi:hypothetical protein
MGMLAAVEMWVKRDHKSEWTEWENRLNHIADAAKKVDGVTAKVTQPGEGLSNRSPRLTLEWDAAKIGITGPEAAKFLLDGEPRIVVAGGQGSRPANMKSSLSFIPYQMMPGDEKVVAQKVAALLSKPPKVAEPEPLQAPSVQISGQWEVQLEFGKGTATHKLLFEQEGSKLVGSHRGEFQAGDLNGTVSGNAVNFRSSIPTLGSRVSFDFAGRVEGEKMSGTVNLGEYGQTTWTAQRHQYRSGNMRRG